MKIVTTRNQHFDEKPLVLRSNHSDKELAKALIIKIRNNNKVRYDSSAKAISQLYKRSKLDQRKFVDRANNIIKDQKTKTIVWRSQEGIFRYIEFIHTSGKVEVVENFGNLFLNSFIEYEN